MKEKEFTAWAIDTQSPEGHGLLGRYFFVRDWPTTPSLEGCRTALFKTRQVARKYCKSISTYEGDTWKPKVVKVKVLIKEA